jgi:hypothetical protein
MLICLLPKEFRAVGNTDLPRGFGIDLWHAVEFSRYERARIWAHFWGRFQGDFPNLATLGLRVKSDALVPVASLQRLQARLECVLKVCPARRVGQIQMAAEGVGRTTLPHA